MLACDSSPTWVTYAVDGVLFFDAMLVVYVMQRADKDQQINRVDARWIRNARRLSFIAVAMLACATILTDLSQVALLLLFVSTTVLLIVDAVALNHRPPQRGVRASSHAGAHAGPLRHIAAMFRHGDSP